ncbi:hypothetical protein ABFS83_13G099200 [Erythranthe nasuta]
MQVGSSSRKRKKSAAAAADVIQVRSSGGGGRKDKHSKVCTARGTTRDRRLRLSPKTAIQFYDVQDRLGYDRPSKAVDWLMNEAKSAIDALLPLPPPVVPLPPPHDIYNNPVFSFDCFPSLSSSSCCYSEFQILPIVVDDDETPQDSVLEHHHHHQASYTWNHMNNNARSQISGRETMFTAQREPLQSIHNYPIITPNYSPPFPGIFNNHSSNSIQELLHMPYNSFLHFQE